MESDESDMEVIDEGSTLTDKTAVTDDAREFRAKRQSYRTLMNEIKENEKESSVAADNFVTSKSQLGKINELFDGVTRINEMVYDSAAVDLFTNREYMNVEKLQTNLTHFDTLEFCEKMLTFMDVNRIVEDDAQEGRGVGVSFESWYKLGCDCSFYKKSPPFYFMYGSYAVEKVEVKKRVIRPREARDTKNPHTKPVEVDKLQAKDQTTEEVQNVLALLNELYEENDNSPISYFSFCIDPTSFSTTVENMFYIAFLIKDHAASIFLDEKNLPVIAPITRADNTKKETKQIVITFDINEYQVDVSPSWGRWSVIT